MSAYITINDGQTKWMYFLIKGDDLLEKYNTIQYKVKLDIKKIMEKILKSTQVDCFLVYLSLIYLTYNNAYKVQVV